MPFGLTSALATFQRLVDLVMSALNLEICLVDVDDIIVFSADEGSHLDRLRTVFSRLRATELKLKPSKCKLFQQRVDFLGHIVSSAGIETDADKVEAVVTWQESQCIHDVRSLLGRCSYYRHFAKCFADIAAPLHALTSKYARFVWTEVCKTVFEVLKWHWCHHQCWQCQRINPFILDTDASEMSIGAVLSQVQNGKEKVIAYASRTYNKSESNYSTTRKELLAVVYFVRLLKHYLMGNKFITGADHAALTWLQRASELMGEQGRWQERLQEYNFDIEHRPRTKHGNADALSRRLCGKPGCFQV